MSAAMLLFLFAPFYSALQRLLFVRFWLIILFQCNYNSGFGFRGNIQMAVGSLSTGDKTSIESDTYPVIFRVILPIFFVFTVASNLALGSIYHYFQQQPIPIGHLPAGNIETYSDLEGVLYMLRPGKGLIYAGGVIFILGACLYIIRRFGKVNETSDDTQSRVFYHYSLIAWIPAGVNPGFMLRAAWISLMILIVGVALSCLK